MTRLFDPALNAEYMPSTRVPDAHAYFGAWARDSAAVRRWCPPQDLAYGPGPRERLDVFHAGPLGPHSARGTALFIHGGYWLAFSRADFSVVAPPLLTLGLRVAVMSYDLAPGASLRRIVRQAREAAAFLGARFGGPLYVAGHSAGAHLAAMIHCADWAAEGLRAPPLAGGIGISGLYDLAPLRRTELQPDLRLSVPGARALSPLSYLPTARAPFVLAVGERESGAFHAQSAALARAWAGTAAPVPRRLPGRHHFDAPDDLAALLRPLLLPGGPYVR